MQSITQILGSASSNPLAVGAISVWLLGVLSFFMRKLPSKLYTFIRARFVVTVTISGLGDPGLLVIESFIIWFMKSNNVKSLRDFCFEPSTENKRNSRPYNATVTNIKDDNILGPGFNTVLFRYNGHLGWFTRKGGKTSETTSNAPELTISFIGNNPNVIYQFLEDIKIKQKDDEISIFNSSGSGREWKQIKNRKKRNIKSVILKEDIKYKIIYNINYFFKNKEWYVNRGMPYKLTYLLHGEPGTGKSSLIFALASYFNRPVYMININNTTDEHFITSINSIPENAFIVFEDMDVSTATAKRDESLDVEVSIDKTPKPLPNMVKTNTLSMSTVLNTLDGIASLDSNIVFITTNFIKNMDAALTRRGRVDYIVEIPLLEDHEVKEYIKLMYPNEVENVDNKYAPIAGCNLQSIFLDHKEDYNSFIKEVPFLINE